MSSPVNKLLQKAQSVVHKPFYQTWDPLHNNERLSAYCAAYVRWCFSGIGSPLPVVSHPEFYRHLGLNYTGVENTADGLSGKLVGDVVRSGMRAGDILLFRNTYGDFPYGTITHVGIASTSAGMMYDAGSGSIVHHRSIEGNFPKLLVEVRRPALLGGDPSPSMSAATGLPHRLESNATRVYYNGHQPSAKLEGNPVRDLTVVLNAGGLVSVNGFAVKAGLVSLLIHDASGKVYKMHKHHGRSMMTEGVQKIVIELKNGLLQVGYADGSRHVDPKAPQEGKQHHGGIGSMAGSAAAGGGGASNIGGMASGGGGGSHAASHEPKLATAASAGSSSSSAGKIMHDVSSLADHALTALAQKTGNALQPLKPSLVDLTVLH